MLIISLKFHYNDAQNTHIIQNIPTRTPKRPRTSQNFKQDDDIVTIDSEAEEQLRMFLQPLFLRDLTGKP